MDCTRVHSSRQHESPEPFDARASLRALPGRVLASSGVVERLAPFSPTRTDWMVGDTYCGKTVYRSRGRCSDASPRLLSPVIGEDAPDRPHGAG